MRPVIHSHLRGHVHAIQSIHLHLPDLLLTGDEGGELRAWLLGFEECIAWYHTSNQTGITSILPTNVKNMFVIVTKTGDVDVVHLVHQGDIDISGWRFEKNMGKCKDGKWFEESFCAARQIDGKTFVGAMGEGKAVVRDLEGKQLEFLSDKEKLGMVMCVGVDKGEILVGYENGQVGLWCKKIKKGWVKRWGLKACNQSVISVVGKDGLWVVGDADGGICGVWEGEIVGRGKVDGGVGGLLWEGKMVVGGVWGKGIVLWNGKRGAKWMHKLGSFGDGSVVGMKKEWIIEGGKDGVVKVWKLN